MQGEQVSALKGHSYVEKNGFHSLNSSLSFLPSYLVPNTPSTTASVELYGRRAKVYQFNYVTHNDYRGRKYFIQPMSGGVAILDYDNDGKMDIFLTNGAELPSMKKSAAFKNSLLKNVGGGVFEDRTSAAGLSGGDSGYNIGVAAGDYDNDGYTDLFLANAGVNTLLHNNGNGTFTDVTKGSGIAKPANTLSVAAAWFDYDNDGLPDLVVSDYTIWTPDTDYQCADSLKREIYCSPTRYVSVQQIGSTTSERANSRMSRNNRVSVRPAAKEWACP